MKSHHKLLLNKNYRIQRFPLLLRVVVAIILGLILGSGVSFRDVGGFTFEDATFKDFNAFRGRFRGWARFCALIFDDAAHLIIKFKQEGDENG